jgi:hypothetical protein
MIKSLTNLSIVCATIISATSIGAHAEVVYLASSYETLYRVTPEREIESFEFDVKLRAMHRSTLTGEIFVFADEGGAGAPSTAYKLNNPVAGTPSLTSYASLSHQYGTVTQIGDCLYGFSSGDLYGIDLSDPANPLETYIGTTGLTRTAGAGYDPDSDTLYTVSYAGTLDRLYVVDPATAAATLVGVLGINGYDYGAEWFAGQLYVAAQNGSSGSLEIGTVNVLNGLYSSMLTIADGASYVATGFTAIPEPTSLILLLVGGLACGRRK